MMFLTLALFAASCVGEQEADMEQACTTRGGGLVLWSSPTISCRRPQCHSRLSRAQAECPKMGHAATPRRPRVASHQALPLRVRDSNRHLSRRLVRARPRPSQYKPAPACMANESDHGNQRDACPRLPRPSAAHQGQRHGELWHILLSPQPTCVAARAGCARARICARARGAVGSRPHVESDREGASQLLN